MHVGAQDLLEDHILVTTVISQESRNMMEVQADKFFHHLVFVSPVLASFKLRVKEFSLLTKG